MKLYTAIIFFKLDTGIQPRKYRNVNNINNLLKFALKSGGWYVNLYDKKTKKFEHREYVTGAS
jgi:hypothetical protein